MPKKKKAIFDKEFRYNQDRHPVTAALSGVVQSTARTMATALDSIADIFSDGKVPKERLAWHKLQNQHVAAFRIRLKSIYKPNTAKLYLQVLRGVLKSAWLIGLMDRDAMEHTLYVKPIKGGPSGSGRMVARHEQVELFRACANDPVRIRGVRDAAIIAFILGTGARKAEAASTLLSNLDLVSNQVRFIGKGNKERRVALQTSTAKAISEWLEFRGHSDGELFLRVSRNGNISERGLGPSAIYDLIVKRGREAGLDEHFSPHDLRRTFITTLFDLGHDAVLISKIAGHESVETTSRYDMRGTDAQVDAVAALDIPFGKKN